MLLNTSVPFTAAVPPERRLQVSCEALSSTSLSFAATEALSAASSFMVKPSSSATGGSFTGSTMIVAVAVAHSPPGSQSW